ncbi:MAG TPA: 4Fe-4S dicluster domain-containing protein [Thermoplasmata archaeon]|nr:4Fe-4S dicluster domain-containing protein [Thermoplasmata archaeon]
MAASTVGERLLLDRADFPALLTAMRTAGYRVVGPTIRDGAIVYGDIRTETDLPIGWTERQDAGKYRLERRTDAALFGYVVGPHSWKKYLFPSHERLWTAMREGTTFTVVAEPPDPAPFAFLGMRACELAALKITDQVFMGGTPDPSYTARRQRILRVAVQCGQSGGTCFCVSMGTGPGVTSDYDLSLTEILSEGRHEFLIVVGTEAGAALLERVPSRPATAEDAATAESIVARTASSMGRSMDPTGLRDLLLSNPDHPRWEQVARRCLSCTNCTMACPTCFCHTTEEVPTLDAEQTERWRRWDSCFNLEFTKLHATSVRASPSSRYRQWLTHKLGSWNDQFGTSGCVGCGRCITWCPVAIDITEEVAALRVPGPTAAPRGVSR